MLHIKNLKKTYNNKLVVNISDFIFEENNLYAVLGENGSGKSTVSKLIAGIINDDLNKNYLEEINKQFTNYDKNKNLVGYLPQKPYIFNMSIEKNILINGEDKKKLNDLMEDFEINYLKNRNAKSFSGGEQQKVSIARFMMKEYKIVIFDEVTSAMDEHSTKITEKNIIKYLKSDYEKFKPIDNKIAIFITHNFEQAKRITKNILWFKNGELIKGV